MSVSRRSKPSEVSLVPLANTPLVPTNTVVPLPVADDSAQLPLQQRPLEQGRSPDPRQPMGMTNVAVIQQDSTMLNDLLQELEEHADLPLESDLAAVVKASEQITGIDDSH